MRTTSGEPRLAAHKLYPQMIAVSPQKKLGHHRAFGPRRRPRFGGYALDLRRPFSTRTVESSCARSTHADSVAIAIKRETERTTATSFAHLSTTCACGAPSAIYLFHPFRAFCGEHAPSQHDSDRA
jgi:hypothetical protein